MPQSIKQYTAAALAEHRLYDAVAFAKGVAAINPEVKVTLMKRSVLMEYKDRKAKVGWPSTVTDVRKDGRKSDTPENLLLAMLTLFVTFEQRAVALNTATRCSNGGYHFNKLVGFLPE